MVTFEEIKYHLVRETAYYPIKQKAAKAANVRCAKCGASHSLILSRLILSNYNISVNQ